MNIMIDVDEAVSREGSAHELDGSTADLEVVSIDHVMVTKHSGPIPLAADPVSYAVLEFGSFLGMRTGRSPTYWSVLSHASEPDDGAPGGASSPA